MKFSQTDLKSPLFKKLLLVMKILPFCLLLGTLQVYASSFGQQRLNLFCHKTEISQILQKIENQADIRFLYQSNLNDLQTTVSINLKNASVSEVLDQIFSKTDLTYQFRDNGLVIIKRRPLVRATATPLFAALPVHRISGTVTDSANNPLEGVSVRIKGNTKGAITDGKGQFNILVSSSDAVLVFSFIGYEVKEVRAGDKTGLHVHLRMIRNELNDVTVVGYGQQKKITVTGAVATVSGEALQQSKYENVSNMLVGAAPGISAVQASGEPGRNSSTIYLRGVSSLNGSSPLIVIDGIQQPTEQTYSIMDQMDANDIDNVAILKDASATAVYGVKGANGVIIITTKRGSVSRPQFSVTGNLGQSRATSLLQTVGSYDYANFRNEAIKNSESYGDHTYDSYLFSDDELWKFKNNRDYTQAEVAAMSLTDDQKTQLNNSPAFYYTSHNYYKELFDGTGHQSQFAVNVSGGTDKIRYFSSAGYYFQSGIFTNTNYCGSNTNSNMRRFNFRSNIDITSIKNFQITANISGESEAIYGPASNYTSAQSTGSRYQTIIQTILKNSPFYGPGIVNGHLVTAYLGDAGSSSNPLGAKGGSGYSPIAALLTEGLYTQWITTLSGSIRINHTMDYLTKGLSAHFTVSYDDSYQRGLFKNNNKTQVYSAERDPTNPNKILFVGGSTAANYIWNDRGNYTWRKVYLEGAINYQHSFGGHTVSALLLGNAQKYTANSMTDNAPSGMMGLSGRLTYNFKERYLLEFNGAYNGTEQFASGQRFGFFPATSIGWVLSNEPLFPKNKWVTYVKFRGSYGEVGSDNLGSRRYLYLPDTWAYKSDATNSYGYYFGNSDGSSANTYYQGAYQSALGNPDVTWERAKKTNIGGDFKFINDKLSATVDLFWEKRNNILITLSSIPGTYGVSSSNIAPSNAGRVKNHGYEISLAWQDQVGKDFSYWLKGNYSFAKNKIEYEGEPTYDYPWMYTAGFPVGQYKGYKTNGFYNTQEELNVRPYNTLGNSAQLGDLKFVDINGDGIIDTKDQVPVGYANVPEINFNLTVGARYKNIDISLLFIGTEKGSFPLEGQLATIFKGNVGTMLQEWYDGHWTEDKYLSGKKISYPAVALSGQGPNTTLSDFWIRSTDFRRLKNAEIGYSFLRPFRKFKGIDIKSIRVYFNGNNLLTWGNHHSLPKGIDPETADDLRNSGGYIFPLTKTFNLGASVQF